MKAVVFDVSVPRYLSARALGGVTDSVLFGRWSGLRLQEAKEPSIPGPDWLKLSVIRAGICGSDIANVTYRSSPAMEPFGSFPAVLGHEILARVEEVGAGVVGFEAGQRVVVDPMISCTVRGFPGDSACPSCAAGAHSTCERAGEDGVVLVGGDPLARGLTVGYHRDLPGGWGEKVVAHRSQVFPVPEVLEDRQAVLTEPLSIGVHAVLRTPLRPDESVLVIGSGPIGLGTVWALRATGFRGNLIAQAKRKHEVELALALGADRAVRPGPEARQALIDTGASAYQPIVGPEVYSGGGFPTVFDCVGSASSLSQALRYAAPRGRIILLGCAGQIRRLDLTMIWARELQVVGFVGYGSEVFRGHSGHTFEITLDLMAQTGQALAGLVTHVFPLEQYRDALRAAANHRRSGAVKVLLTP